MNKIEKITQILDQFLKEELGNRLSQFSMIALKEMILNELKQVEDVKGNKKEEITENKK